MDKKDILKSVYDDFFGIDKIAKENEKLSEEIAKLKTDFDYLNNNSILNMTDAEIPEIEVNRETASLQDATIEEKEYTKEEKDEAMTHFFEKIEQLYIDNKSKELLKKIIEYMRKYNDEIEKQYISFNMCIYSNNYETIKDVIAVLEDSGSFFKYIKKGEAKIFSMFDIEKIEQIENMYSSSSNIVVLKDLENFNSREQDFRSRFLHKFEEKIVLTSKDVLTILVASNKEITNQIYADNENIKNVFDDFEIIGNNPDVQDAYQDILNRLNDNMTIDEDFKIKLLDYVSVTYTNNNLPYPKYRDGVCEKILFTKTIPEYEKEKTMEEIFEELNSLVGLEKVKQVLRDLVSLIELKDKAQDDLKIKNVNLHMIFLGNPGTGKTTVARIVAEMLYNLKYVKQNKLIEVSSKDLVAEYVGQTAPKTMSVVQKALGGVLFVDEAYSLASGNGVGNSYNEEAIATLIQAMENYRDNLVVIFAGYTKEMQDFLNANSGIVSRIGYTLEFDDYTTEELKKIFIQMMEKSGFTVTDDAMEKVENLINEYRGSPNFGNARFVRNLYEKAVVKHASNTAGKKSKKLLKTITKEDINAENLLK